MWQAISRLLSEQLGEGEIELRNELPGGEVHACLLYTSWYQQSDLPSDGTSACESGRSRYDKRGQAR